MAKPFSPMEQKPNIVVPPVVVTSTTAAPPEPAQLPPTIVPPATVPPPAPLPNVVTTLVAKDAKPLVAVVSFDGSSIRTQTVEVSASVEPPMRNKEAIRLALEKLGIWSAPVGPTVEWTG